MYSVRLNGTGHDTTGLVKSLAVMPGDRIRVEVYGKYVDPEQSNWKQVLIDLMSEIATGAAPTVLEGRAPEPGEVFTLADLLDASKSTQTGPQAYLNYLVFDKNRDLIADKSGFDPLTGGKEDGSDVAHDTLKTGYIDIDQPGFVYIYLSNDNPEPMDVYFDDFEVEHIQSPIVQTDDYYPFGLSFNSYKRENTIANKFLFAGKERQNDLDLNWFDFVARMYAPDIARWNGIDASAENYVSQSPYHYAGNNPIKFVDFDGNDYGVKVDRGNKTITIKAHFLTSSKSSTAFKENGSSRWNAESGKTVFVAGGLKALRQGKADVYSINVAMTSEVSGGADGQGRYESDRDQQANQDQTGTVNSFDVETEKFVENQGGGTLDNQVDLKNGEENSSTTTHEVNHAMGIAHTKDGGNQSPNGGGSVGTGQIGETLKGVGIGGDNVSRNSKSAVGDGKLLNNSSNQGLEQGKVITVKRYERIMGRMERRENRQN